jgi:hypothetical protein
MKLRARVSGTAGSVEPGFVEEESGSEPTPVYNIRLARNLFFGDPGLHSL